MRTVYTNGRKFFVERNFEKGRFYEVFIDDGEIIHLVGRHQKENDVTNAGLSPAKIKLNGVENYI